MGARRGNNVIMPIISIVRLKIGYLICKWQSVVWKRSAIVKTGGERGTREGLAVPPRADTQLLQFR